MSFFRRRKAAAPSLPVLRTERLVLRSFDPSDAVSVYAYAQSEKVGPMAGFAPHRTLEDSRRMVDKFIETGEHWAVVEKSTGRVIGSISLQKDAKRPKMENARSMGYVLGEAYWGQGFATEACRAVLAYAFCELECPVVSAGHFPINQKSRRVLKKLGFVYEGTMRRAARLYDGSFAELLIYSLFKEEYEAQLAAASK